MSADNWTICPDCVKRARALRDAFREKYYGKLDSYVFTKIFEEVERAVKHIESHSSYEFKPNEEILKLADEKEISVKYHDNEYDSYEILQQGNISSSLREDYEQGVDDEGLIYIRYSCSCDCGFDKNYSYDEPKPNSEPDGSTHNKDLTENQK